MMNNNMSRIYIVFLSGARIIPILALTGDTIRNTLLAPGAIILMPVDIVTQILDMFLIQIVLNDSH